MSSETSVTQGSFTRESTVVTSFATLPSPISLPPSPMPMVAVVMPEQVIGAGGVLRDVAPAHVAVLQVMGEAAALDGDDDRGVVVGYKLLRECFAFGVVRDGEVYDRRGIALNGFHDSSAVGVGYIGNGVAELFEGIADGNRARRPVCLYHACVKDVEAGYDEGGARVVEYELGCAVAEVGRHIGAQVRDASTVVVRG